MLGLPRRYAIGGIVLLAAGLTLFATARSVPDQKVPLAIQGYDPVAYFTVGKPTRGVPAFAHVWDEQRYLFVNAEHRDRFKADPVRYAPQFAGLCAMSLTRGEITE